MNNQLQSELLNCINSYPKDTLAIACDNISNFNLNSNLEGINIASNVKFIKLIPKNSQYNYQLFNNNSELELVSIVDKNSESNQSTNTIVNNTNKTTTNQSINKNHTNNNYKTTEEVSSYNYDKPISSIAFEYLVYFILGCTLIALITVICKLFNKTTIVIYRDYCDALCSLGHYIILILAFMLYIIDNVSIVAILLTSIASCLLLGYNLYCSISTNYNLFHIIVSFITKIILGIVTLFYIHSFFCKPRRSDDETTYEYHKRCKDYSRDSLIKSTILLTIMYNIIEYRVFIYDPNNMVEEEEYNEDDEEYYDEDEYDEYEEIDNKKHLK